MAEHSIVANDEHPSWPLTLGYQQKDGTPIVGIPAGAEWPNGTTVWMVSTKRESGDPSKIRQVVVVSPTEHTIRYDPVVGDYANTDVGAHDVQWKARYPDGTTETWPKSGQFDTLIVGANLGDPPAL